MGHRQARRVPIDFDWPVNKVWGGYLSPEWRPCPWCAGNATVFAGHTWTAGQWLASFRDDSTSVNSLLFGDASGLHVGNPGGVS